MTEKELREITGRIELMERVIRDLKDILQEKVWVHEYSDRIQIDLRAKDKTIIFNVNPGQIIEFDKAYGPISTELVRIYIDNKVDPWNWAIERYNEKIEEWQTKARWGIQESYEDSNGME